MHCTQTTNEWVWFYKSAASLWLVFYQNLMIQTLIELLTKQISAFYVMQNVFVLIYEHHICSSHGYLYNDLDILEYNFKLMSF